MLNVQKTLTNHEVHFSNLSPTTIAEQTCLIIITQIYILYLSSSPPCPRILQKRFIAVTMLATPAVGFFVLYPLILRLVFGLEVWSQDDTFT